MSDIDYLPLSALVADVIDNRGRTCPTSDSGIPLIATNCIKEDRIYPTPEKVRYVSEQTHKEWFRGHPKPGDILFVNKGTPGRVCLVPDPIDFCIAQDMVALRADESIVTSSYLFAALRSPQVKASIENMHVGTMIPHFKKGDFDKLFIPVPDISVQERIGDLYCLFSLAIENNRKTNETLEAIAKALFKSWFVDFDPVRAKAEGRPTGLPDEISDLFPDSLEDSELGEIPSGWRVEAVGDVIESVGGSTPSTSESEYWDDGEYFWATPKDLSSLSEPFILDTAKKITKAGVQRISSGVLPAGTVLLSSRAPVGYIAVATVPLSINQGFIALKSNDLASSAYLLNWCLSNVQQFKDRASGTTFPEISKAAFRPIPFLVPSKQIMSAFSTKAQVLYDRVVSAMKQSHSLAKSRDALLPKLISGEIRIPDAERLLDELGV